jgi:glycosyltransferase involved in cell wall biosynthesis
VKLSVNILTWNTINTLRETLKVLENELQGIESEIIIVDNGSTDGCQDVATIKNEQNRGISVGKNQGIDASRGDFIMLLDGDIVPVPNSIRLLLLHLESNPECDAIGFMPNRFSNSKNTGGQKNYEEFCHKLEPIREHRGHCIYYGMYRRSVWKNADGTNRVRMDEGYGIGYGWEDLDSYIQMRELGIKQWVAGINHECGKYYHEINSSIRQMGFQQYMRTSLERGVRFKEKWGKALNAGERIAQPS